MNVRKYLVAAVVAVVAASASPAAAADRILHHAIDRTSGAIVRVIQTTSGNRVEVESQGLRVSRQIAGRKVITVIRDQRDELVISFERGRLTVTSPAGRVSAVTSQAAEMSAARALIDRFPGSRKALAAINRLGFGPETPILPLLVTTRAFLQAVTNSTVTAVENAGFGRKVDAAYASRLMKVAFVQDGKKVTDLTPTQCWEAYTKEAIAAYIEYEQCVKDLKWYDFLDMTACAAIYDLRAIGAFTWWASCVSIG